MDDNSTEVTNIVGPNTISDKDPKSLPDEGSQEDVDDTTIPSEVVFLEPNSSNDDVICIKKEAVRRKAVLWPPIEKHEGKKLVFPFFDRDICDCDFQFCSHMVMEQVFVSSHGSKNKIWEGIRTLLAEKRDENGKLVFPDGINSIQTLCRRADVLMKWIKKHRDTAALRSGTDNEVHSEFITLLEILLEQKESSEEEAAEKLAETSKSNKQKATEAEVLRVAAMSSSEGRKRLAEVLETSDRKKPNTKVAPPETPMTAVTAASFSSMSRFSPGVGSDFMMLASTLSQQHEGKERRSVEKAEKEKAKLELRRLGREIKLQQMADDREKRQLDKAKSQGNVNQLEHAIMALMDHQKESFRLQQESIHEQTKKMDEMKEILQKIVDK
jgi:hypothetical protein